MSLYGTFETNENVEFQETSFFKHLKNVKVNVRLCCHVHVIHAYNI